MTYDEYERLVEFLGKREQSISEYLLMSIAVLLESEDFECEKRNRKTRKGPKKSVTVKCSDYLYNTVSELAQNNGVSKAELLGSAIKDALIV